MTAEDVIEFCADHTQRTGASPMLALSLPDVSSSALTAVRWRRELLVGDEDAPPRSPVAHH